MSTKTPVVLKVNIWHILDHMQVQYRETKIRFDCIHLSLIDISSLQDPHRTMTTHAIPKEHHKQGSAGLGNSEGTTKRIVHKASKLFFRLGHKDKERGSGKVSMNRSTPKEKEKEKEKDLPKQPSGSSGDPTFSMTQSSS